MSLSPAGFRRRLAYDVIQDYVLSILDDSENMMHREAKVKLIPGFIAAILQKISPARLRNIVKLCVDLYSVFGIKLPDPEEDILTWIKRCIERQQGETTQQWMTRVAVAAHCILSYACIEEAILVESRRTLY